MNTEGPHAPKGGASYTHRGGLLYLQWAHYTYRGAYFADRGDSSIYIGASYTS